ncbi:GTPase IMAP family member 9-like [Aplochiton taeniatus]
MELVSGSELRLALLGKSGNGKNSVANSVLGASAHASKVTSSITQHYHLATGQFCGRQISILDTAVPWDTQQSTKKVQEEVRKCVRLLTPGPHAFLLVLEIEKSNSEEREMVRQIQQALGPKALEYMMVVFTHGDCLDERVSVGDLLVEDSDSLGKMVTSCGGRFCIFNKHSAKSKEQSVKLLSMVDQILQTNGGKYFTSKMLQAADEEEERLAKNMEGLLRTQLTTPVREWHHHKKIQLNNFRSTEDPILQDPSF